MKFLGESSRRCKDNHSKAMKSPKTRQNLRLAVTEETKRKSSERLKTRWLESREQVLRETTSEDVLQRRIRSFKETLENPEIKQRFLQSCRAPDRLQTISKKSKEMWETASDEKIKAMLPQWKKKVSFHGKKMNLLEKKFAEFLEELKVSWEYEPLVRFEGRLLKPDFVVNKSVVCEIYGDFWHGNPKRFQPEDTLYGDMTASQKWQNDLNRRCLLETKFPKVLYFWENEINEDGLEVIKKRLVNND